MIPDDELQAMRALVDEDASIAEWRSRGTTALASLPMLLDEIDRLKAELAASEVHWTTKDPSMPGWYWHRWKDSKEVIKIYRVFDNGPNTRLKVRHGPDDIGSLAAFRDDRREWSDKPIPMPEERT